MYHIFVSYAQPQIEWATHLRQILTAPGVSVFVAEHDLPAGDSLSQEIVTRIKRCDLFLLLWTEDARESQYVAKEYFLAKAEGKRIIPVALQTGVPLPAELADLKYLDVARHHMGAVKWLETHVSGEAQSKATGTLVTAGLTAFLAWAVLKG